MSPLVSPLDEFLPVFFDTETTGLDVTTDELLSISLVNYDGVVLLNTLVRPVRHTRWLKAQQVHGIAPADVLRPEVPTFAELAPQLAELTHGRLLVCYKSDFDCAFVAAALVLGPPASICCAMEEYAAFYGDWSDYHQSFTYQSLASAAHYVLHTWRGQAHSSLADCFALRDVWEFLHWPAKQEAVAAEKERQAVRAEEKRHVNAFLARRQAEEQQRQQQLNDAWVAAHPHRLGQLPRAHKALDSAEVFSQHLLGHPVTTWNAYGAKLKLRQYVTGAKRPAHLVRQDAGTHHFLRRTWRPANQRQLTELPGPVIPAVAMQLVANYPPSHLAPLFDLRKLQLGVDYVPVSPYEWPEGHCSATTLRKKYKLKPKEIAQLQPTYLRYGKDFGGNRTEYLLYAIPEHLVVVEDADPVEQADSRLAA